MADPSTFIRLRARNRLNCSIFELGALPFVFFTGMQTVRMDHPWLRLTGGETGRNFRRKEEDPSWQRFLQLREAGKMRWPAYG